MKLYTLTYNANQPTIQQLNVPTNTSFLIGVKATRNGVPVEIDTSKAVLIADNGDQTSADEVLTNGYVTFQMNSTDEASLTTYSLDVDGDSLGDFKVILNIVKSGVGETSDIDAVEAKIPTKTSQLTNDSGYITSQQVEPSIVSGQQGWAKKATGSIVLYGRNSPTAVDENKFVTMDFNNSNKLAQAENTYAPWTLEMFNGTTFDPPLEMTYAYRDKVAVKIGNRVKQINIDSYCWLAYASGPTAYYIKASESDSGQLVLDDNIYVNSTAHPITFSTNKLSVETMDGVTGNIICTRPNASKIQNIRYIAYEDDVATQLSAKVSGSSVGQAPAILSATSVYASDWATLSSTADENTMYVVLPDPVLLTRVKYTTASGYPDWESDIVGEISCGGDGIPTKQIPNVKYVQELSIGSHVTSIGDYAFGDCSNITSVTIPDNVLSVGSQAFSSCRGLTSVTIPNSVTNVDNGAFEYCFGLTSVTVENGVTRLGDYSFYGCSSLSSFTIPSSVTSVGDDIFSDCTNLMSVTWQGKTMAQVQEYDLAHLGLQGGCVIHCTDGDITIQ